MVSTFLLLILVGLHGLQQAPEKLTLPGAKNVTRVDAAVMCAGATTSDAFPEIKKLGFASVINLRRDGEPGVDIAAARGAASAHGLKYVHIPVDSSNPSTESVDEFMKAVADPANQPAYIHCGSANRVAALWLIKRVVADGWEVTRATDEATAIGLTSPMLRKFALDYVAAHKR
jgi:uncharacterized protein (TIGR01244 family)